MNNKGFSLVELLSVIVILAIIMSIGVVSYKTIISNSEDRSYKVYEKSMQSSAMMYIIDNGVPSNGKITLSELIQENRIDYFTDPNSKERCLGSYVLVENDDSDVDSYSYKVCLICPSYRSRGC